MHRKFILLALGLALVVTSVASGSALAVPVTFVSQERYVEGWYGETHEIESATDFGPFSAGVYPCPGYVYGMQDSTLGLVSTGHLYARGAHGLARSRVKLIFTVNEPVDYQFDATMSSYVCYDGWGSTWVVLERSSGPIIIDYGGDMSLSGTLSSGTYMFEALAGGGQGSQSGWGWGDMDFTLTLTPEPTSFILFAILSLVALQRR